MDIAAPRENLFRAIGHAVELRAPEDDDDSALGIMTGRFAPFNEWAEIDSIWEGHFLERFLPGAFKRTIKNNISKIRTLFQHGMDPQIGDKPMGVPRLLEEQEDAVHYEVPLLDTSYNRDLEPGLRAGVYGASHRFSVVEETWVNEPEASDYNPDRLPERSISEAKLYEFGPVTWPAYEGASAGMRSITDAIMLRPFVANPAELLRDPARMENLLNSLRTAGTALPPGPAPAPEHVRDETREQPSAPRKVRKFKSREEFLTWIQSI